MPMRVGFVQYRMKLLQEELDKIIAMLPQLGVRRAILLNPPLPGHGGAGHAPEAGDDHGGRPAIRPEA